jgi:uncharacterized protein YlzI (FlbEa/FlbD family)
MIRLTTLDGRAIYISVAQLVAIRPPAKDAGRRANAWVDLTSGKPLAVRESPEDINRKLVMIPLTNLDGQAIYISVAQLVAIRPPANDADGKANAWVDLTSGKPLAVRESPEDIIRKLPVNV